MTVIAGHGLHFGCAGKSPVKYKQKSVSWGGTHGTFIRVAGQSLLLVYQVFTIINAGVCHSE